MPKWLYMQYTYTKRSHPCPNGPIRSKHTKRSPPCPNGSIYTVHILRDHPYKRVLQETCSSGWPRRLIILQTCKRNGHNLAKSCKNLGRLQGFLQDVSDLGRPELQVSCKTLLYGHIHVQMVLYAVHILIDQLHAQMARVYTQYTC